MNTGKATTNYGEESVLTLKNEERMAGPGPAENPIEVVWWAGGGFFILLGAIFLLWRTGLTFLGEMSWLVWMLIPLYFVAVGTYHSYVKSGRKLSAPVIIWSILPFLFLAVGFVIGWNVAWPFVLIAIGAATLLGQNIARK